MSDIEKDLSRLDTGIKGRSRSQVTPNPAMVPMAIIE